MNQKCLSVTVTFSFSSDHRKGFFTLKGPLFTEFLQAFPPTRKQSRVLPKATIDFKAFVVTRQLRRFGFTGFFGIKFYSLLRFWHRKFFPKSFYHHVELMSFLNDFFRYIFHFGTPFHFDKCFWPEKRVWRA